MPSSSPWVFPAVVISRGTKKRLCVNYIPLNEQTISVAQPLPRAEDIMNDITGCFLFKSLDLKFAYWQIRVRKEDQPKTLFITHHGTFQWTRMSFGIKNAYATFQKVMQSTFQLLKPRHSKCGIRVYLDDILLFATNFLEFVDLVQEALSLLLKRGFKVTLAKCQIAVPSLTLLGYVLSQEGKQPNPAKVEAILKMLVPTNAKSVLSWLQTTNFYRRFIPNFAKISAPLQAIIRSGTFKWAPACESAFEAL